MKIMMAITWCALWLGIFTIMKINLHGVMNHGCCFKSEKKVGALSVESLAAGDQIS